MPGWRILTRGHRLPLEAPNHVVVRAVRGPQHLDRHRVAQGQVLGAVHRAHAAAPHQVVDPVALGQHGVRRERRLLVLGGGSARRRGHRAAGDGEQHRADLELASLAEGPGRAGLAVQQRGPAATEVHELEAASSLGEAEVPRRHPVVGEHQLAVARATQHRATSRHHQHRARGTTGVQTELPPVAQQGRGTGPHPGGVQVHVHSVPEHRPSDAPSMLGDVPGLRASRRVRSLARRVHW